VRVQHAIKERDDGRSTDRILTTHTGSLPRPDDLLPLLREFDAGELKDRTAIDAAIAATVGKQIEAGIDIVNDGEMSKPSYWKQCTASSPRLPTKSSNGCTPARLVAPILPARTSTSCKQFDLRQDAHCGERTFKRWEITKISIRMPRKFGGPPASARFDENHDLKANWNAGPRQTTR
jgi:hypothetical protein